MSKGELKVHGNIYGVGVRSFTEYATVATLRFEETDESVDLVVNGSYGEFYYEAVYFVGSEEEDFSDAFYETIRDEAHLRETLEDYYELLKED